MKNVEKTVNDLRKQLELCEQLCNDTCEYSNHPKYGEFEKLVKEQNHLISALETMMSLSEVLSKKNDRESNNHRIKTLLSTVINKSTGLASLIAVITKKKTNRREYWKSYYKKHKREIQLRHRGYTKKESTSNGRARNKEYILEYKYKTRERTAVLNKMRNFCFGGSSGKKDFLNELKRCVNSAKRDDE